MSKKTLLLKKNFGSVTLNIMKENVCRYSTYFPAHFIRKLVMILKYAANKFTFPKLSVEVNRTIPICGELLRFAELVGAVFFFVWIRSQNFITAPTPPKKQYTSTLHTWGSSGWFASTTTRLKNSARQSRHNN